MASGYGLPTVMEFYYYCMQGVFAEVYELAAVEDVNRVIFAAPAPLPDLALDGSAGAAMRAAEKLLPLSRAEGDAARAAVPPEAPLIEQLQRLRLVPAPVSEV